MKVTASQPQILDHIDKVTDKYLRLALKQAGNRILNLLKEAFSKQDINASYQTIHSMKLPERIRRVNGVYHASVQPTGARAQIMKYIEYGRRPGGAPPVEAILEWGMDKFGWDSGNDTWRSAKAISRKIGREGTKGKFVFRKVRRQIAKELPKIVAPYLRQAQKELKKSGKGR